MRIWQDRHFISIAFWGDFSKNDWINHLKTLDTPLHPFKMEEKCLDNSSTCILSFHPSQGNPYRTGPLCSFKPGVFWCLLKIIETLEEENVPSLESILTSFPSLKIEPPIFLKNEVLRLEAFNIQGTSDLSLFKANYHFLNPESTSPPGYLLQGDLELYEGANPDDAYPFLLAWLKSTGLQDLEIQKLQQIPPGKKINLNLRVNLSFLYPLIQRITNSTLQDWLSFLVKPLPEITKTHSCPSPAKTTQVALAT